MKKVAIVRCENYDPELLRQKTKEAFELLGGAKNLVSPEETVFVKVNALASSPPEEAVVTHPELARAVIEELLKVTQKVIIGDSPSGPFTPSTLKRIYKGCGYEKIAHETGASLSFDTSVEQVEVPEGNAIKSVSLCRAINEADRVVSISKWKTHMLTGITGAIKNMFGAVAGMNKITYHSRFSREEDFSELLVDVLLAKPPDIHIVDAIVGMDGNGPRRGNLKQMGIIAAGTCAFALDAVMMRLINHDISENKPLLAAMRRGFLDPDLEDVEILGEDPNSLVINDFMMPDKKQLSSRIPSPLMDIFGRWLALNPRPILENCTSCGKCVESCPAKAIEIEGKCAKINQKKCIRCYCCQEICDSEAIELKKPFIFKIASKIAGG
ncbi:MAG: DUF362 domain-containing protein [Actinomycetota bacterium]|nr:DUF362 domain-containing protein [Actinomycetota bacterium]